MGVVVSVTVTRMIGVEVCFAVTNTVGVAWTVVIGMLVERGVSKTTGVYVLVGVMVTVVVVYIVVVGTTVESGVMKIEGVWFSVACGVIVVVGVTNTVGVTVALPATLVVCNCQQIIPQKDEKGTYLSNSRYGSGRDGAYG